MSERTASRGAKAGLPALMMLLTLLAPLLTGCVSQLPKLVGEPTPSPTPTPPLPTIAQNYELEGERLDAAGALILDEETHYERYLSFEGFRVYDYGDDTFLDGLCINTYTQALYGSYKIEYKDEDSTLIADGILRFDDDEHLIPVGKTRVYATIDTDMRVDTLPLNILKLENLRPYTEAAHGQLD